MESGGRIRLVAVLPLVGAMALPGDPWGRVRQVGRFSLFSGSQEKQHLPHKEPPYAEESEAGHSKGPYLPVQNNSALRSSCPPWFPTRSRRGCLPWSTFPGCWRVAMRPPFSLAASQPSQPFHLAEGKSRHIPLAHPHPLTSIFKARTSFPWEKEPLFSTCEEEFYSFPCLKHVHVNCPLGYVFVAELTWAIPACINYYRINLACVRAAAPPTNVWIMQCKYINSWRAVLTWAQVCNPWQANKAHGKATPHGNQGEV